MGVRRVKRGTEGEREAALLCGGCCQPWVLGCGCEFRRSGASECFPSSFEHTNQNLRALSLARRKASLWMNIGAFIFVVAGGLVASTAVAAGLLLVPGLLLDRPQGTAGTLLGHRWFCPLREQMQGTYLLSGVCSRAGVFFNLNARASLAPPSLASVLHTSTVFPPTLMCFLSDGHGFGGAGAVAPRSPFGVRCGVGRHV